MRVQPSDRVKEHLAGYYAQINAHLYEFTFSFFELYSIQKMIEAGIRRLGTNPEAAEAVSICRRYVHRWKFDFDNDDSQKSYRVLIPAMDLLLVHTAMGMGLGVHGWTPEQVEWMEIFLRHLAQRIDPEHRAYFQECEQMIYDAKEHRERAEEDNAKSH